MLLLRSVVFTIIMPGTVTVVIPYLIIPRERTTALEHWAGVQYPSLIAIAIGVAILFRCIWDFARVGRGTLAPIDPPSELVVQGLYRYVRNPMYLGVLIILLGETIMFESTAVLLYAAVWLVVVQLFVVLYEEPALRRRFGESYGRYYHAVHHWLPGKPFDGTRR